LGGLALRGPHPPAEKNCDVQVREAPKIVAAGYRIILNVGDQMSDLNGNPSRLPVKLPNPFYYLP